ncbi:solute carrier family 2, facilitated glucose transporter member 8-like isoform X1 [Anneissia japonica]|uniref:solute carrier family 2, facilitated glucose transporter member 8-like isoform X1 n=1 Tax=Anneissia japonica TaxID=1529436 RepID=UPI001425B11B|nr:solute carrier family 2, facilitated glucose transporter member 8-like isoform X1 [Anneissia japonica]
MLAEKGELKAQNKNLYVASLVAQLGSFMMGYTLAYTSPAIPDMEDRGVLKTTDQISWFGSLMAIGAIFGGPIAGFFVGNYGRKVAMMMCFLPFVVGYGLISSLDNIATLYFGRILTDVGAGMVSFSTPVYIAELSSLDLRGMLVGVSHPFIGGGMLPVNALGCDDGSLGVLVLWGVCFLSTIFVALCVPETKGKSLEEITKDFNRYNRHL